MSLPSPSCGVIRAIRWYQRDVSPGRAASCRYLPTCSAYSAQAIAHYGLLRGGAKTAWRLLRCNPFSHGGYDPAIPDPSGDDPLTPESGGLHHEPQAAAMLHVQPPQGRRR